MLLDPYRACLNIKNIRDAQGKVIKTICSTDLFVTHSTNRRNCETFNMNLLKLDTPEVTTAVFAYAGDQYMRGLPYHIFTDGSYGNNWCRCISNLKTGIATSFARLICPCSDALFAMCEFKFPRSMRLNWKKKNIFNWQIKLVLAPSICDVKRDLKNSAGTYLKSVCTVYQDLNYDTAAATCVANGMTLLNVDSVELENIMISYSNIQWSYGFFWYLGKTGSLCSTLTNDKKLFYFKAQIACTFAVFFHCEYQGKITTNQVTTMDSTNLFQ